MRWTSGPLTGTEGDMAKPSDSKWWGGWYIPVHQKTELQLVVQSCAHGVHLSFYFIILEPSLAGMFTLSVMLSTLVYGLCKVAARSRSEEIR